VPKGFKQTTIAT